jgi:hypothetical protein
MSVIRLLVIGALFIFAGHVAATPYSFSVDHIMLLGNLAGFVEDEFDDGVLAPWEVDDPTAIESGGVVTLSNPGNIDSYQIGNYFITEEQSEIRLVDNLGVEDGGGDFIGTSRWLPIVPEPNQLFRMRTYIDYPVSSSEVSIDIGVANIDNLFSDIFGIQAGLSIFAHEQTEDIGGGSIQLFPIAAEDIRDSILLSMYFDDSHDLFRGSFSIDGGVTILSPFDPFSVEMHEAVFDGWELTAVSYEVESVPEPSTYLLMITGLAGLGFTCWRKIKI